MRSYEIKFRFDNELLTKTQLDYIFDKIGKSLDIRFDKNLKPYVADNDNIYDMIDISNLNQETVDNEISSFFRFDFEEIIDVPLYKFLVLKNNDEYTILANISSLIFDYNSINNIYDLFNEKDYKNTSENILKHYEYSESYLSSSEFKTDYEYWKNYLSDSKNARKFHNIKSSDYNNIKILYNNEQLTKFLTENNLNKFVYFTGVFSLYLSRIDRTNGCILNTVTSNENTAFENKTLLNIKYLKNAPFIDYLNQIKKDYDLASEHTKVDISNYLDEKLSYYSIYDLINFENISILNGGGSALTLNIYDEYIDLIYNKELFTDVYIEYMAANLESLIENILKSPNQLCCDVDILSDDEKELISNYSYGGFTSIDEDRTLAVALRENAANNPDFIAIDDGVNRVSYGDMEKSSNSIAWDLVNNYGVSEGDCVALMMPRNYHFPELVIALNKIGAVIIPISFSYPVKRIEHMLEFSEAKYIILMSDMAEKFDFPVEVICFEDLNQTLDVNFEINNVKGNLCCMLFTSGTTGAPKGVMISNKQIIGLCVAFNKILEKSDRNITGFLAEFTAGAVFRLFCALYFGQTCRIFNENEQKDQFLLLKAVLENPMLDLMVPPFIVNAILENPNVDIEYIISGGAKLNDLNCKSKSKIVNLYGLTETGLCISNVYDLDSSSEVHVPIGKPHVNFWAYILDDNGNQLPVGVPGEICISSEYMSQGYVANPELTAKSFIDNPNCNCQSNEKLYRTGDIGYFNFNGEIEILGRSDDQLSVRGFRVESAEILNIMNSFEQIDTVYLDVDNETLYAYYTVNDEVDVEDIRNALKSELPSYMIPSVFMELDEIPLNPNGKIDKFALRSMSEKNEVEIDDEVLKTVVNGFKEVLKKDHVLTDDDFVALGGNSISAMNLQVFIKNQFNVSLSSNKILELSTPINISNYIKLSTENQVDKLNYNFDGTCPLSESQLNVYLDELANNMETEYNNPFKIELKNKYSFENIEKSIDGLFEIYPVLSARVLIDEGIPSFFFDVKPQVSEGSIKDIETFIKPFNLEESLTRFLLVEDDESVILCMDFHHLIFDGTSFDILFNTLIRLLDGQSVDFIDDGVLRQLSYEENNIDSKYMDNAAEFFKNALVDEDETLDLVPYSFNEDTCNYEYVDFFKINGNLNSFLQDSLITANQFFTSAFAYTLSRFTGSDKVLFNIIENGRGHTDLSNSVGMFVRTLPVLINCENQNVDSFLKYSSQLINSTMNYDLYPYRILANEYELNSEIYFQYAHNIFTDSLNNELITHIEELPHDLKVDLSFFIFNSNENEYGIRVIFSDKFDEKFIKRFIDSYKLVLKEITNVDELSDINYVSNDDLKFLNNINNTEYDLKYNDVMEAFNDNLAKHSDNKLVSFEDISYSYCEGAFIADKIAKKLTEIGVESQDCVSFLVERSELYMFCILGILSAGCVYVPLDDKHPDERLSFILKDTQSKVVIVSDDTYEYAKNLVSDDVALLNISEIVNDEIGMLSCLPINYGDLACILYTSGTTGIPKGVKITRKAILNFTEFYVNSSALNDECVYGLYASIGFDVAIKGIFSSIYAGASLNIIPNDIKLNMNALNDYFIKHNVTHTHITTQVAKLFINNISDTSLKTLVTGCLLVQICTMSLLFGANDSLGVIKLMYDIFGSFNDNVLPGYKKFPNANLIENLPEKEGIGLVEYVKQKQKFNFENNDFYDLITKMLCIDPTKRITAKECLTHPWFRSIDKV